MGDLERLRRRLWLAVLATTVGCASGDADTEQTPRAAEEEEPATAEPSDGSEPPPPKTDDGGMASIVDAARVEAEAAEQARIEAAKPKVDAKTVCSIAVDKTEAVAGRLLHTSDELGCPQRTSSGSGSSKYSTLILAVPQTQTLRDGGDEDNCCYRRQRPPTRGRPYRVEGTLRLPDFTVGRRLEGRRTESCAAAAGWLHDAREELASVPAFERAAVELASVAAPRGLIDACLVAAQQERRHAALCLTIAERLAGRELHLGPAPSVQPRSVDVLGLLMHTFEEGCVGETIAAVVAERSARGASAAIAATLQKIANDETEHAALAWRTLAWGLPRLADHERREFFRWAASCIASDAPTETKPCTSAAYGRLTAQCQAQIAARVCRRVIEPMLGDMQRSLAAAPSSVTRADA